MSVSWQDLLISGLLFSSTFTHQLFQGSTGMTFLSGSIQLPVWNPYFAALETFLVVSTNTPQALCLSISQENSLNIG
jgi:hypothetical protein